MQNTKNNKCTKCNSTLYNSLGYVFCPKCNIQERDDIQYKSSNSDFLKLRDYVTLWYHSVGFNKPENVFCLVDSNNQHNVTKFIFNIKNAEHILDFLTDCNQGGYIMINNGDFVVRKLHNDVAFECNPVSAREIDITNKVTEVCDFLKTHLGRKL